MDENNQTPPPSPADPPSEFGPLRLQRGEHPISRRDIDPDVLKIINRLHQQGFTAYLVGGAVRDLLLGRQPKDFDVVTDARPGQIKKRFRNAFLIGRRFRLAHVHFSEGKIIEVATFRRDPELGRTPPDTTEPEHASDEEGTSAPPRQAHDHPNIYGTPAEDAFRRDTTINALFYDTITSTIIDYVGGLEDMARKKVRIIGNPAERLTEDPVRIWRVIRQAARLRFDIEETTEQAIPGLGHLVGGCAPSRLFEELNKEMAGESRPVFEALGRNGILRFILGKVGQDFETESAVFSRVLNLLEAKDAAAGQAFTPEELYSLLFWPWVEPLFAEPQGDMHAILKEALTGARIQAQLPKALQAGIIQTLIIIGSMTRALRTGRMRWSLKERPHYEQASRLTFLIDKGHLPEAHESFVSLFHSAFPGSSTKPRRRRRRRGPGPRPPAG